MQMVIISGILACDCTYFCHNSATLGVLHNLTHRCCQSFCIARGGIGEEFLFLTLAGQTINKALSLCSFVSLYLIPLFSFKVEVKVKLVKLIPQSF